MIELMNPHASGKFRDIRLLIFDLDGTLIDSEADLALSVNAMLARIGREPLQRPVIASYVGQGVTVLVKRALGAAEAPLEEAVAFFLDYYREHMLDHTALYPGVREALEELIPRKLVVLTNKPVNFSRQILAGLGVDRFFSLVYGGNSFEQKKPHPAGILRSMEECRSRATETLMVGDSETDVLTGRNAGAWTCGVTYGIGSQTLARAEPDFFVDDLRELPRFLAACEQAATAGAIRDIELSSPSRENSRGS
ncbi:MAG: HAD family hydrolase [Terriglobia bacterium]